MVRAGRAFVAVGRVAVVAAACASDAVRLQEVAVIELVNL